MLNILITGANGQLGSEMRARSVATPHRFHFTDVAELDITDREAVRRCMVEQKIDVVVNCAAYTNVDKAEDDIALSNLLNNTAVENIAVAAAEVKATLIHISTDYVFQGTSNLPCREDEPTDPLGVYGRTKLAGEQAVIGSGVNYLIFRTAWLYSEYGNNFVKTMMRLTAEREQLNVVFDQVGTPTYAGDLADAILSIIGAGSYSDNAGIYHFSNEGVCSWYDFAREIAREAGNVQCDVRPCHSSEFPSKVRRPAFSVLDKTRIKTTFDIKVPYWRDSLTACMKKLKTQ